MNTAERGVTTVADRVTAKIARQAAAEATAKTGGHVLRSAATTRGRHVEVTVEVDLPPSAPADTGRMVHLRDHLTDRTRHLTGLAVTPARLRVRRLHPLAARPLPEAEQQPATVGRLWSPRRAAATGTALAVGVLAALTLWSVLHQHLPGIAAPPWEQVRQWASLSGCRSLARPAALAAAAAGAWLVLLAATPGHRRLLPLGCPRSARAVISRTHAARLIRAAVTEVPGLRVHSVHFTPRKVTVRAEAAYGTPHDVRGTTNTTIERTLRSMVLRHPPQVRLLLRPAQDPHTAPDRRPAQEDGNA
ncbi:DUF6286 domain-containing protein [Streptomyces omiyaensis]|uniref:DUF6286 domain-containing protein n=1 Tax=Streptomyces omiyaensis TaxID=68247 RepID=A0ABW7BRG4_9ACTN|nr:DUF6286 domain-containing protein [Streptomyces omiyaensis]GGY38484.1 hypothetical protein GCM10010363_19100 [Streptomyces omiyaensis]